MLNVLPLQLTFVAEKHEEQVKAKNGSLMSLLNSGGNDTFVAGQVEGVYGG